MLSFYPIDFSNDTNSSATGGAISIEAEKLMFQEILGHPFRLFTSAGLAGDLPHLASILNLLYSKKNNKGIPKPDWIFTGPNRGENLGIDSFYYSETVSVAASALTKQ